MRRFRLVGVIACAIASLTFAGCGDRNGQSGGDSVEPTMTIQEAVGRVDAYMDQGRAALGEQTTFTDDFRKDRMACDDPTDQGPAGRVFATRDAQIVGLADPSKEAVFGNLRNWWSTAGFRETSAKVDAIYGENIHDGFRMSLQTNVKGEFYLGVSSPCVWPNGTPEPKS